MTVEQNDLHQFLITHVPFNELETAATDFLMKSIQVIYLTKENSNKLFTPDKPCLYLVRTGAFDLMSVKGDVITDLNSGDYFGYTALLTKEASLTHVHVKEEGLVYVISESSFEFLRNKYQAFEQYFLRAHANRLLSESYKSMQKNWSERKVSELMTFGVVTLSPEASIRQTAKKMSAHCVSSIMITLNKKLVGVVTDRDLRNRVLAAEVSPTQSVDHIMSANPKFIFENNRVFTALNIMLRHNIHHLPVLDKNHQPLGMLTSRDLLKQQKSDPIQLIARIYQTNTVKDLNRCAKDIPDLLEGYSYKGEDISLMGKLLAGLSDALTCRLIYLFQEMKGAATTPFAWICFAEQAREEQTLYSSQGSGLILSDNLDTKQQLYFKNMANFVCENLAVCGLNYCSDNVMASDENHRQEISNWLSNISQWVNDPINLKQIAKCSDLRFIDGSTELYELFVQENLKIKNNTDFLAKMALDINSNLVPLGLFNHFKLEKTYENNKYIDLKAKGVDIITDLARLYSLKYGISSANTLERLTQLAKLPELNNQDMYDLKDCWRYLTQLSLRTHRRGLNVPANYINPENFSQIKNQQLKEAFNLLKQAQQVAVNKFPSIAD